MFYPVSEGYSLKGYFLATILVTTLFLLFILGGESISKAEFCISCHSMNFPFEEYKKSQHFKSPSGVRAGCSDCHVGKGLRRVTMAKRLAADLWAEFFNPIVDEESWKKRRAELARVERERLVKNDSSPCKGCHDAPSMISERVRKKAAHARIDTEGMSCIECHYNIAHDEILWEGGIASR